MEAFAEEARGTDDAEGFASGAWSCSWHEVFPLQRFGLKTAVAENLIRKTTWDAPIWKRLNLLLHTIPFSGLQSHIGMISHTSLDHRRVDLDASGMGENGCSIDIRNFIKIYPADGNTPNLT